MIGKLVALLFLVVFAKAEDPVWGIGPCPKVTTAKNFDAKAYMGTWYQILRFPNPFENGNCSTTKYVLSANGTINVHNVAIVNGTEGSIDGAIEVTDPNSTDAKLTMTLFDPEIVSDYWILGTDYGNYSVVWSCQETLNLNIQFSWILGRTKPLPYVENVAAISEIIKANNIGNKYTLHDLPECANEP